ncbi:MAG: alpha/beta hydrolase [Clostridia bacterium]|nr:alpha/beta hydrolase [Clostridia bacterium]
MVSLMGKVVRTALYLFASVNPERVKSAIPGCSGLDKIFWKTPNREFKHYDAKTKNGTKYEVYLPKSGAKNDNVVYYLHGGAYIGKQNWIYRYQSRYYSQAAGGATVVYVDYDVAPEAKYPTQLNQALDVWDEITGKLGFKAENVVCGGDSAGGNLCLAMMLKLRDAGKPMPRGAFCYSPWTDMLATGDSYVDNYTVDIMFGKKNGVLDDKVREKFMNYDVYSWCLGSDRADPYVSPVNGDYHDFPPMCFTVGCDEMLRSDTETIVKNLHKNKVPVTVFRGNGMWHVFTLFHGIIPEATAAFSVVTNFISDRFETWDYSYPSKKYRLS